ncbi:E3 ubiquitin-protein ligase At1g63170-like isoform X1 [Olea europaea var. sylvestris]|uniref:E3 ubiquitin-protein ligase At1g63170-like isoform X1 n=1 Tax=Olea europaea var. sylvestris TaxID=158386 RepID=UPI000C1CDB06|nr:E3 ubiquitin-protein ligase At1g63170-like isoform X1 [Olea europaea var. sylvestris]
MSIRYFLMTPDQLCNSSSVASFSPVLPREAVENRDISANNLRNRAAPFADFLIRLAMRISRSRCYSFLRRVFHYQNGSRLDLSSNPFNSRTWMLIEFLALTFQITLITYTLSISKDEKPVWPMRLWVSGYAFGCFLSLILLNWRYLFFYVTQRNNDPSFSDIEQQRNVQESRSLQNMDKCRTWLELLFAIWFVMGNVWVFDSRFGLFRQAPKLNVLCISLLSWNAFSYSFPFLLFVLLCCCVPMLSSFLGYNMNMASHDRGATDEQLAKLPAWKYKDIGNSFDLGNSTKDDENTECCICLAKYRVKDEIRQLPCTHIFHLKCVDQWLKIISCCPLCKHGLEK